MFRHKYKCRKCGYFTIETNSAIPPPPQQHLFFKQYNIVEHGKSIWGDMAIGVGRRIEDCMIYVKYEDTQVVGIAQITLPQRKQQARMMAQTEGRNRKNVAMVAAMYDNTLNRWFVGTTGHVPHQGHIPAGIWITIPAHINTEKYEFGRTCAEVDCLRQSYGMRNGPQRLLGVDGCVFAAYSPIERNARPPCNGCKIWLKAAGAEWVDP